MTPTKIYEGTLEEITAQYGVELQGRHLRVLVDDDVRSVQDSSCSESAAEWVKAFSDWVSSHIETDVHLSDEALSRDSIYEGRC